MELPRVKLGSPIPITPTKRRRGVVEDLLAQFQSKNSPSSVTKARKASLNTTDDTGDRKELRKCKPVTYTVPADSDDGSPSPSATSSYESPEKSQPTSMEDSEDELAKSERLSSAGHSLRPRSILTQRAGLESLKLDAPRRRNLDAGRRQSARRLNKILISDTLGTNQKVKPSKAKIETARSRVRDEIAARTIVKRDRFLLANQDYFLPLLPENNYISKLYDRGVDSSIVEYTELQTQPKGVKATMKPYQLGGLSFLVHLYNNGMCGMLGDEMGLGKTLQTLSLFQYLEELDEATSSPSEEIRPYLVVCPLSVLSSWISEARRWVPNLKVLRFHGPTSERARLKKVVSGQEDWYGNETNQSKKRKADRKSGKHVSKLPSGADETEGNYKIVITTYDTFAAEQSWFKKAFVWRYVVLDEGHKIKNNITQISTSLQGLKAEFRLILTGTPLQNNLHEMWALLHWLYPDVFTEKSAELFKSSFDLNRGKVSTSVMDDARRLLELIMLRRMKNSPGVNLGLPPKEEVLLYVPLTPMQRFWYTRLLTRVGNGMLDDLFADVKAKEKDALVREIQEDQQWAQVEELEKNADEKPDEWQETREIVQQALEQEKQDSTVRSAWQKLMNLIMQLRKCCSHPYLLPNAAPDPYHLGEHVIRASGKFIVLEKLLRHAIHEQGKKVLIFSSFTKTLDCCEDLLALIGGRGESFQYLRFDGQTARARRNLGIRMFNDLKSDYKVMLLSTRAGGLGINLASASDIIFMDEDWNPQITLQAEARAHRIGQTNPVTIYKLCTQGTVEEQMMGRIRKKLYLSAKITESMRNIHSEKSTKTKKRKSAIRSNIDDMPQLDTSQLKSLVRRGAQTLSHPEIDVTEMLSWDIDTMLEKCRDKPSDLHINPESTSFSEVDEEKWLSVMERVECAVFDGKRYQRDLTASSIPAILPSEITREDRRIGKNTTVMIDGFAINKESLSCGDWEAVPTMAGKDPRLADIKREKKPEINHESVCHVCYDGGTLTLCQGCPRSYHNGCLEPAFQVQAKAWRGFYCQQHECVDCGKKTSDAGGMIFRCRWCPRGYCEDCLDWDKTVLVGENLKEFEMLGEEVNRNAFFIRCPPCGELERTDPTMEEFYGNMEREYDTQHQEYVEAMEAARQVFQEQMEMVKKMDEDMAREMLRQEMEEKAQSEEAALSPSLEAPSLVGSAIDTPATVESGVSTPKMMLKLNMSGKRGNANRKKKRKVEEDFNDSDWDVDTDPLMMAAKKARVEMV
ncbi:hypothetical protein K432DRAFT_407770 [Lepidopterella palustris CBS 459.81]|uniref:ISWI chromatin-remodeling complex ATPase ISW2 n=1 Tax=Lepidopterella palustris CBS 459.81 TaxID=1314670 RepID=A0A8E2JC34_9PEZI|nr:hypothetical protein K432DRAFT_407770 [Lepidopterella palustris CBS 459.81]